MDKFTSTHSLAAHQAPPPLKGESVENLALAEPMFTPAEQTPGPSLGQRISRLLDGISGVLCCMDASEDRIALTDDS